MVKTALDEEWCVLAGLLPAGWRELARSTGAMRRARGEISSPDQLLQLLLLHVSSGLSLKQAVARAEAQGLASISDVGLLKRLRSSEAWLRELSRGLFDNTRYASVEATAPEGRRLRAVDATTVEEPGATGTDWRVHYSISLPELRCDYYELTDVKGAESYKRIPVSPGDIILADRGYCRREDVAHVLAHGGDAIVRLSSTGFPLREAGGGQALALLPLLRTLEGCAPGEWPVSFEAAGISWDARVCAIRKSAEAAELAKRKLHRRASKKGQKLQPETLEFAEYVFVLATVNQDVLSTDGVLQLYRARWQIELCFKRIKSLLKLGHLPKRSDASARAWIQGKLLTVLLVERLIDEARFFSPWGHVLAPA